MAFFQEVELPEQKTYSDGVVFPVVLSPTTDANVTYLQEAIRAEKPWLESLLKKSGVILFRGFPVTTASDFNDVIEAFGYPETPYIGGRASRTQVVGRVYTANETPPDKRIPFHHEMAYVPDSPTKLFFFCEEEPGSRGETPIVLSHIVYEKMKEKHPGFVAQLEEHGLTYVTIAGDVDDPSSFTGSSWKSAYKTDDKNVAEERAAKLGTKIEWMGNTAKVITGPIRAIRFDEASQRKTWFNSLAGTYGVPKTDSLNTSVELGSGDPINDDAMKDLLKIFKEECVAIPWKKGDVLLVNNLTVLHSRWPLIKPPRRILASLCKIYDKGISIELGNGEAVPDEAMIDCLKILEEECNLDFPSKLFFYCEEEPGKGGETAIVLSHVIHEKICKSHPELVVKLEKHGVTYITIAGDEDHSSAIGGISWKSAYLTDDKNIAEERAAKLGAKLEWMGNAVKIISGPRQAIRFNEENQRKTWFLNHGFVPMKSNTSDHGQYFELGNGDLVPDHAINECLKMMEEECVAIPWKKGDVMLINNLMVLHSRLPLITPPRRILASLCK
ncbi:hypothetical protein QVD17_11078 [Tagetes erecta]|uniref:TauD/TfdA-like domain-containing protein n=1 Tax=Tagetes erecta TaxID=13708 RepID=A0AAD8P068_TARER|nr:hypothetical protein QVD17_11078 [Tagetes erecta]